MCDRLDEQAFLEPPGNDRRTGFAALEKRHSRIDAQAAEFAIGMAGIAVGRQHGSNSRLKELNLLVGLLSESENPGRNEEKCGFPA